MCKAEIGRGTMVKNYAVLEGRVVEEGKGGEKVEEGRGGEKGKDERKIGEGRGGGRVRGDD